MKVHLEFLLLLISFSVLLSSVLHVPGYTTVTEYACTMQLNKFSFVSVVIVGLSDNTGVVSLLLLMTCL